MTRITQAQIGRNSLNTLVDARERYDKYSNEISSGFKVSAPGESRLSGTINQYRDLMTKIEGHETRIQSAKSQMAFQDNAMAQLNDLLVRAK